MAGLTTHILDTAHGCPAAGMTVRLFGSGDGTTKPALLGTHVTNADGRCKGPLLDAGALNVGRYWLEFDVGDYFRAKGVSLSNPAFLEVVRVDFGIADPGSHYHVPLLVSPYGYSTYRGS